MLTNNKLIEFLSKQENIEFLFQIEPLIPQAKEVFFRQRFNFFVEKLVSPLLIQWNEYKLVLKNDELIIKNLNYDDDYFFHLDIYLGINDKNNWYGVIGNQDYFELSIPELDELKMLLNKIVTKRWYQWIGYKYFSRNRMGLVQIKNENELENFFQDWAGEFWNFANDVKGVLEITNKAVKLRTSGLKD